MMALMQGIVRGFRFSPEDRYLVILPLGHTAAINYSFFPSIWLGSTLILAASFWAICEQFWELISIHKS
jgi:acyl-CoA synthetase (AMP-forming)/AMP-acid ligase II